MTCSLTAHIECRAENVLLSLITSGQVSEVIVHRIFAAFLGLVLAVAGLVASGYIPANFKGDTLLSGSVAALVPGVLMLSAFYMAFKFLKFAVTGKK
jgi:uncharacterized membrane protein YjjP (DUF1212 family)